MLPQLPHFSNSEDIARLPYRYVLLKIDPSAGFEEVVKAFSKAFPGTIVVPTEE
jgi:hypothetical protein